jgi:hypothetical protein
MLTFRRHFRIEFSQAGGQGVKYTHSVPGMEISPPTPFHTIIIAYSIKNISI